GQGLGRWLLRSLLEIARRDGAERMFLEVRPSNPHAVALYEDEGFNEIGRRPRYYPTHGGREDAIVMARELLPDGDWPTPRPEARVSASRGAALSRAGRAGR